MKVELLVLVDTLDHDTTESVATFVSELLLGHLVAEVRYQVGPPLAKATEAIVVSEEARRKAALFAGASLAKRVRVLMKAGRVRVEDQEYVLAQLEAAVAEAVAAERQRCLHIVHSSSPWVGRAGSPDDCRRNREGRVMIWEELGWEKNCADCHGTGKAEVPDIMGGRRQVYCPWCNATGKVPSELGEQVLAFAARYLQAGSEWTPSPLTRRKS